MDYLKNLNEAQKEAVTHLEGPLLIVAGAGSFGRCLGRHYLFDYRKVFTVQGFRILTS